MGISARRIEALRAMSRGGTEHEKKAAQSILSRMNIEDEAPESQECFNFRIENDYEDTLFRQIAGMVFETNQPRIFTRKRATKIKMVICTKRERDEIDLYYDAYRRAMGSELNITVCAFIQKNNIFPSDMIENPPDREVAAETRRMLRRAADMEKVQVRKQIDAGSVA